jgi:ABC-type amino acid transport substrate-binding protein
MMHDVLLGSYLPPRRSDLRIVKIALLIGALVFALSGCGKKEKEIASAADSMQKNKLVRIVTDAVNIPFEFGSGTGVQGLDVDIGNEIGKDLGLEVKWSKVPGYDRLFELLEGGDAEILISAIAIDPKRADKFAFSKPYFDSGDAIAHRLDKEIKDLSGLSGKKVGVGAGRSGDKFMARQKTAANVAVTRFPNLDDALGALNRMEIDAVVGDEPILTYSGFTSFPNLTTAKGSLQSYQYAVVVRKDEKELLAKINQTLDRLKSSGELDALKAKWFKDVKEKAGQQRDKYQQEEALKKSPKNISVIINKIKGGREFNMDRLDGFVLVLEGPAGKYQSDSIRTEGDRGTCRFTTPIPPGEYKLVLKIFQTTATVTVLDLPKSSLTMTMNISRDISITLK